MMKGAVQAPVEEKDLVAYMQTSLQGIKECSEKIRNYEDNLNTVLDGLMKIEKAVETMKGIETGDITKAFPNIFKSIHKMLPVAKKLLGTSKENNASDMINRTRDVLSNTVQYDASEHAKHLFLTAGFPEKGDMARVEKDIQSQWFREKIARRKSTKNSN
uniref:BAR domain-containing protein n=1 Tax=Caenorhabditis tropicalis TaxID=1561998 RepID=A0A1I7U3I0_9PELO